MMLEADQPEFYRDVVLGALSEGRPLVEFLPAAYRDRILAEARAEGDKKESGDQSEAPREQAPDRPTIRMTSFEGSKGLSAQHVFILGLQDGDLRGVAKHR